MKTNLTILLASALIPVLSVTHAHVQAQESARTVFEQARLLDERNQNLADAIALYERVASRETREPRLAAEAQYRAGLLHERLGNADKAQKAFRAVVERFPREEEMIRRARAKLTAPALPELRLRQVWTGPDADLEGMPSPDGRYLTFTDWDTGDLAVRDLINGTNRRLTNKGSWFDADQWAENSIFSPDGRRIAYTWFNGDSFFDLRIINLDGTGVHVVHANRELEYLQPFDWSPDGGEILAVLRHTSGTSDLVAISTASGDVRLLKHLEWRIPLTARFSPDGRSIVYDAPVAEKAQERDVYLLTLDGQEEAALVEHPAADHLIGWTPDGKGILFGSDRTGSPGVWFMQVREDRPFGKPELVKADIGRHTRPMGITRNGSYYYGVDIRNTDAYTVGLDPQNGRPAGEPARVQRRFEGSSAKPIYSPDGRHLAYTIRPSYLAGDRTPRMIIRSIDGDEEREIVPDLRGMQHGGWTSDGQSFLVGGSDAIGMGVFLVNAGSGAVTAVRRSTADAFAGFPMSVPGTGAIIYRHFDVSEKVYSLRSMDAESRNEDEILRLDPGVNLVFPAISPDGRSIAFVRTEKEGEQRFSALVVLSLREGITRTVVRETEPAEKVWLRSLVWTPDSEHVLFVKSPEDGAAELWRVNADSQELTMLELKMDGLGNLSIHPDGLRLGFQAGYNKSEVWVMEGFLPAVQPNE